MFADLLNPRRVIGIRRVALVCLLLMGAATSNAQILERLWTRYTPNCQTYAVAADGSVVVSSDGDGTVRSFGRDGRILWSVRFSTCVTCVPANEGKLYIAFVPGDSKHRSVALLDRTGKTIRVETAPGPVQSASVSDDGNTAVILSAPARVTVLHRRGNYWHWQRTLLPGTVSSLSLNGDDSLIAVAHRNPAGIVLLNRRLKTVWRYHDARDAGYRIRFAASGTVIGALTTPPPGGIAQAIYWRTDRSQPLWRKTLRGDLARMDLSPDGAYMATGYRTRLWHRNISVVEPRVALYTNTGRALWEVGGLIFGAQLIGTSSPVLVLVHDGNRVIAALDRDGHMRARRRLWAPIRSCVMARGGSYFAVMTDAHVLYLFRAR